LQRERLAAAAAHGVGPQQLRDFAEISLFFFQKQAFKEKTNLLHNRLAVFSAILDLLLPRSSTSTSHILNDLPAK
jgi:hypothetical protein